MLEGWNKTQLKWGRNDCVKMEKGERTGEPKCCAEGQLQTRDKWEEASENIIV